MTINDKLSRARDQFTVHRNTHHLFQVCTIKQPVFSRFALPETTPVRDVCLRVAALRSRSTRYHLSTVRYRARIDSYRHPILFILLDLPMPFHKISQVRETSGAIVGWPDNAFVMACSTLKLQQFTPSHFVSFHIFRMLSFFVIAISNCRVPSVGLPDSACRPSSKD